LCKRKGRYEDESDKKKQRSKQFGSFIFHVVEKLYTSHQNDKQFAALADINKQRLVFTSISNCYETNKFVVANGTHT
jgi:hypothetical protein